MTRTSPAYIQGRVIIYLYLPLGRLARENDEDRSVTICYNYDSNGNILSKVEYPYTTGALTSAIRTVPYTYAVSWGDQLLTYNNGSPILYDQIGNPLSYNGYTFTWQKGRQLASANDGTNSYQFIYNADGQRTWKTKNNSSTQYTYASGLLVSMTDGTNTLNFTYDPDGIALGVNLNGTDYYYLYNAQGDVIALYDSAGTVVTEYKYDSWGKVLSVTGSAANTIGLLNPLRYRGYFYDNDLGFYLLETRYYDPETGRFINIDEVLDNRAPGNHNLYCYCKNNPINLKDVDGNLPWLAIGIAIGVSTVVGAAIGGIAGALSAKKNKKSIRQGAIDGAKYGAKTGFVSGAVSKARIGKRAKGAIRTASAVGIAYINSRKSHAKKTNAEKAQNNKAAFSRYKIKNKVTKKICYTINAGRTQEEKAQDRAVLASSLAMGLVSSLWSGVGDEAFDNLSNSIMNVSSQIGYSSASEINANAAQAVVDEVIEILAGN